MDEIPASGHTTWLADLARDTLADPRDLNRYWTDGWPREAIEMAARTTQCGIRLADALPVCAALIETRPAPPIDRATEALSRTGLGED